MSGDWLRRIIHRSPHTERAPAQEMDDKASKRKSGGTAGGERAQLNTYDILQLVLEQKETGHQGSCPRAKVPPSGNRRMSFRMPDIRKLVGGMRRALSRSKKVSPPDPRPVATSAETHVPSKRPHHIKADILPWFANMHDAAQLATHKQCNDFIEMVNNNSAFSPEKRQLLVDTAIEVRDANLEALDTELQALLALPEFADLGSGVLADDEEAARYKALSQATEKKMHDCIGRFARLCTLQCEHRVEEQAKLHEMTPLSPPAQQALADFRQQAIEGAADLEAYCRFEIVHGQPIWDPENVTSHQMTFSSSVNPEKQVEATSSLQAQGLGAYTSQAPRNRKASSAVVVNFFRSTFSIGGKTPLDVTRSGTLTEHGLEDETERREATQELVGQVLDVQSENHLKGMTWEEIEALGENDVIEVKSTYVGLLTPDRIRKWLRKYDTLGNIARGIHEAISGSLGDDERKLATETTEAYEHWNGETKTYTVHGPDGASREVKVRYRTSTFNIPNNVLYEQIPGFLTYSRKLRRANKKSFEILSADVRGKVGQLDEEFAEVYPNVSPEERRQLNNLTQLRNAKRKQRQAVSKKTRKSGGRSSSKKKFKEWQQTADAFAGQLRELKADENLSAEMQEALALMDESDFIEDLHLDTEELFKSGIGRNVKSMDNNRSALASRMVLLSGLASGQTHFGCRSGKDRTGLVDIEMKILLVARELYGRNLSYREIERHPDIIELRKTMTEESGNVRDIITAVMGAAMGINSAGSASDPLQERDPRDQQKHIGYTKASQAFSRVAHRPPTNPDVQMPVGFDRRDQRNQPIVIQAVAPAA